MALISTGIAAAITTGSAAATFKFGALCSAAVSKLAISTYGVACAIFAGVTIACFQHFRTDYKDAHTFIRNVVNSPTYGPFGSFVKTILRLSDEILSYLRVLEPRA